MSLFFNMLSTARRSKQSILKEISPVCSLEGLMLKLKLQYFGYLMQRVDSLKKTEAGKDWWQEEKGTTGDEMAGWHHQLSGHGFGWTLGVGDGQGGLAWCGSWGHKESDTTERLNWTEPRNTATLLELIYHLKCWTLPVLKVAVSIFNDFLFLLRQQLLGRQRLTPPLPCSFPMDKMINKFESFDEWMNLNLCSGFCPFSLLKIFLVLSV